MTSLLCVRCYGRGQPKSLTRGHSLITLALLAATIVLGIGWGLAAGILGGVGLIAYSLWRLTGGRKICGICGSGELVPAESQRGREILSKLPSLASQVSALPVALPARPMTAADKLAIAVSVILFVVMVVYLAVVK